mgnify:CR=1 FL=1
MLVTVLAVSCSPQTQDTSSAESSDKPIIPQETSKNKEVLSSSSAQNSVSVPVNTSTPITETSPAVHTITPEEAKLMMDQGNVTIVDVRRVDEYEAGHIPGAILVPNETILTEAETKLPDKNAVLLIYCRSGRRSAEAAQKLLSLGYSQVYDFGGILNWHYDITR